MKRIYNSLLELEREYMNMYLCDFKPDMRAIELHERLQKYYDETPDSMSNKDALQKWKEFKEWCNYFGYTQEDINNAKKEKFNFD